MTPTVSIVIPTWQRHELLRDCIKNINEQHFPKDELEIVIVSDGLVQDMFGLRVSIGYFNMFDIYDDRIKIVELGRNWSGLDRSSFGIAPLLVGYLCASGKYIMPWCDDERALTYEHIQKLVTLIETPLELGYPDFVFPRVHIWRNGDPTNRENQVIGVYPPVHGQITHYLFRPENFIKYGYPDWGSDPVDWSLIEKWMRNGAKGAMLNEVTFEHRLDR